jgi:hypothetical protein
VVLEKDGDQSDRACCLLRHVTAGKAQCKGREEEEEDANSYWVKLKIED